MTLAIETRGLNYHFGQQQVVNELSLQVPKGSIYGFLGPNGAGKTTTIKILLNLLQAPREKVFIFGKDLAEHRIESLRRLGSLVEQPAIYGHMSGMENLHNRCLLLGISKARAAEMLALVGLTDAARKKAGKYSLGMKQRLGIALALLSDPELLLLDEPTNGLDPNGIIEIRNLLIRLATERGKTILVSSHLLAEIERTATHVGIINKGKLLFQGTIADLQQLSQPVVAIDTDDPVRAQTLLHAAGYPAETEGAQIRIPFQTPADHAQANKLLVEAGIAVHALQPLRKDLEHLFLDITKNN
ncbi:ABC transporter ATP-binding protein [Pedobacter yulinensis]|uniref:ABC transporter ATP-binding protein n=1 Tax=Pedobacter yulinensis TaxID=2126353 RepID=A0A2T3HQU8_9SPHI|nr:ATP-binding cassette domain-containing protein [Pedobacter yulinensis]PST84840.1 ABC transporter ATP-binding protein [Pedobacter yulinensis]